MLRRLLAMAPALLLFAGLAARPVSAQAGARWRSRRDAGHVQLRRMEGLPSQWVEKLEDMSPAQQERFLENNERFQNLPPWRQAQIRRNLRRWNKLTPEQKQAARRAERVLQRMTPEQRAYVRHTLLPQWRALSRDRRMAIRRRLVILSHMSPATQQAALQDPKFLRGLRPVDRQILRNLNSLRNPHPRSK